VATEGGVGRRAAVRAVCGGQGGVGRAERRRLPAGWRSRPRVARWRSWDVWGGGEPKGRGVATSRAAITAQGRPVALVANVRRRSAAVAGERQAPGGTPQRPGGGGTTA
jgi:hypothetical protein